MSLIGEVFVFNGERRVVTDLVTHPDGRFDIISDDLVLKNCYPMSIDLPEAKPFDGYFGFSIRWD